MGYTTDFNGEFELDHPLTPEHKAYLAKFSDTRRMRRDEAVVATMPDPLRIAVGLPVGFEGGYYVGEGDRFSSQPINGTDPSVLDGNEPPGCPPSSAFYEKAKNGGGQSWYNEYTIAKEAAMVLGIAQPGLWCQWVPNGSGTAIVWDEGEKFYEYIEWIKYLIAHFLGPWGYKLNGEVYWNGEESDDRGLIRIIDNEVKILNAVITYR